MISINSLLPDFELQQPKSYTNWLGAVIESENKVEGEISYIFCDDEFLLGINQSFLNHDTFTDIITFPTSRSDVVVSGEIYISIPRVEENAVKNQCVFSQEISRVLVHGVLHLLGYKDGTSPDNLEMRALEDFYLNLQP
jgi:probable rRNA maturation factor